MKFLDILSKVATFLILVIIIIVMLDLQDKPSMFYEYKDSKINLTQVKKIEPRVDYIITLKEDKSRDIFRKYSTPLNEKEIKNIEAILSLAQKSEYYNVEIIAYMMLDAQKVDLYHSNRYVKRVSNYSVNENLLDTLSNYGLDDFQYSNLEKLKGVVYEDSIKFLDDVVAYAKLKKSGWSEDNIPTLGLGTDGIKFMKNIPQEVADNNLSNDDIKGIVGSLNNAYSMYTDIK